MTPLTIELFEHSQGDGMSATRLDSAIHWWKSLNWLRVIAEFAGFLAETVGLRKWAAEAALVHPPHPSREPLL